MPGPTVELNARHGHEGKRPTTSIHVGSVTNNCDLLHQGKVLVRIPSVNQEVWARISGPGGGARTGVFHPPNIGDEVLIALVNNEPGHAFVLGGLWGTTSIPPSDSPAPVPTQRALRSGLTAAVGHSIVMDDLDQSLTITTSLGHKVAMDATTIKLSTAGGTVSVTLDLISQKVSISAPLGISLESKGAISLDATKITIKAKATVDIQGRMVNIN
jgi:uncharacterized protein involved in type VI secretion and phage assembly